MATRIRGTYAGAFSRNLLDTTRWLDPADGQAYAAEIGGERQWTFWLAVDGLWRDGPRWFKPDIQLGTAETPVLTPELAKAGGLDPKFGFKEDDGKPNWFLLMSGKGCAGALAAVVRVLSFATRAKDKGGKGYTEHSWRDVPNGVERYESALYRHLNKVALGELVDDESGESHWAHIATNALFLAELHKAGA